MVSKLDRDERGVGLQNFHYPPAYDEFVHIVKIHSPRAHRYLSKHLPARTQRSYRSVSIFLMYRQKINFCELN